LSITQQLADFISTRKADLISADVRSRAARCLLDTLAVSVAGYCDPSVRALEDALCPADGMRTVAMPWSPRRYREDDACLVTGMSSHILDYDDVSMLAVCHPSVPVLTALWPLLEETGASGRALLDAYVVGTEVLIRSGQAMGFRHYALGFHATATLGTLGAAAACCHMLGLDSRRTAHALAIAASMSAGVRKNFGSMVKSLHVGLAASSGLRAARFAAAGVQGAAEPLEADGWLRAFSGGDCDTWPDGLVLGRPFAIEAPGFEQKRYPCCYMMHKIIQATLTLKREHGLALEGLRAATIDMCGGASAPLMHPHPKNGLHAKFSGPYAVVGSLLDGRMDLASFRDETVLRPAVQAALGVVSLRESSQAPAQGGDVGSAPVTVTLDYGQGGRYSATVHAMPGSAQDPLTDRDLLEKWRDCLARGLPELGAATVDELFRKGLAMDAQASVQQWLDELRPHS